MPAPSPGRRGARPRNRRELILAAAADLFAKHGYAKVAMGVVDDHVHHGSAEAWLVASDKGFATCPITQAV